MSSAVESHQPERRRLLQLLAATAALAGRGCSGPPDEKIVPYARAPEQLLPGEAVFYASALTHSGYGMGVLVETNGGRPTKVEGNPRHPASLGSTDPQMQAAVLQLWDPARSSALLRRHQIATWQTLQSMIEGQRAQFERDRGAGLFILMRPHSSPTLARQLEALRAHYPRVRVHGYDPLTRDAGAAGTQLAFGRPLEPLWHLDRALTLVTLDADFLAGRPSSVRNARDFAALRDPQAAMSRVHAIESTPGLIGAAADERWALPPTAIEHLAYRLAAAFGLGPGTLVPAPAPQREAALIQELRQRSGSVLIIPGDGMPPAVHALACALNERLGRRGLTHDYIEPIIMPTDPTASLAALVEAIHANQVRLLLVLDGNPVYDAPSDIDFGAALEQVSQSVHLSLYVDETSDRCTWHVPATHAFEHWSDLRAYDGTPSVVQPIIAPLYGGHSAHDLLNLLTPLQSTDVQAQVRETWNDHLPTGADEAWREALRNGVIAGTAATPTTAAMRRLELALPKAPAPTDTASLEVIFAADQSVHDGQWANNAWLQELPRSMSKLTWGNAAYLSASTAARLGVATGDELWLQPPAGTANATAAVPGATMSRRLRVGVWVLPDHADDCVTLPLGYGRSRAGPVGNDVGFNAYLLRTVATPWRSHVRGEASGTRWSPALTQRESDVQGRDDLIRRATLTQFSRDPHFANATAHQRVPTESLYPEYPHEGYRWAMSIDLNACIGCNACTIACQAENNIPPVGPQQVRLGRVMHWIRVDRYYLDDRAAFQPVPCMHCEHAPCEEVCPVGATVHDSQGLNLQVYNRCVGTRFCSNNCPYKVRRFNFLQYSNLAEESLKALQNPDVTVRQRGVMEKCTYCIQRIERGRIDAERLGRRIQDGEVITACQAACPTRAIRFGDLNDPNAEIARIKASPRNYALLAELNTRPRTTYLARVRHDSEDHA